MKLGGLVFGSQFIKRFALCYRSVVCLSRGLGDVYKRQRVITAWNGLAVGTDFRSLARFKNSILAATGKMRMCGRADLRILERVRVKIMDLD